MPKLWTWHMGWTLESERFENSDCDSRSLRIQQARIEPLPSLSIRYPPARSMLLFGVFLRSWLLKRDLVLYLSWLCLLARD